MAEEKIVTLNLRKKMLKVGGWRRKKVIVGKIKDYVAKIFDVEEIILEKKLSERFSSHPSIHRYCGSQRRREGIFESFGKIQA